MTERFADDVATLAKLFQAGDWTELRIEADGFSVLLSRNPQASGGAALKNLTGTPASRQELSSEPVARSSTPAAAPAASVDRDASWQAVPAPNLGTFYRSPKPGAPPFVAIGDRVEAATEICLLEVMKLFTSVKAGVAGIVREIAAHDAELVEGGQPLFYIEPQGS